MGMNVLTEVHIIYHELLGSQAQWVVKGFLLEIGCHKELLGSTDLGTIGSVWYSVQPKAKSSNPERSKANEVLLLVHYNFVMRPLSIGMIYTKLAFCIWKQNSRGL